MASGESTSASWKLPFSQAWAQSALAHTAKCWFAVTVAGQIVFAAYILFLYGAAAARSDFAAWNQVMTHGHVEGASAGNAATAIHLLGAALIMLSGAMQLVPRLRHKAPAFHCWNGRVYLGAAVVASVTGTYMVWWRGAVGDTVQHIGTTLNGLAILLSAFMALKYIRVRNIEAHRRWALRLFLVVSGVWFFRIGLMFWLALNRGPAGFDPATFQGPFLTFLAFAQWLVPLAILELYIRCRTHGGAAAHLSMSFLMAAVTLAMAIGIGIATVNMWLPNIL